ncbi:hypothetical protein GUITHDRAFT_48650, partial [Guillardia theta CCMP2712]
HHCRRCGYCVEGMDHHCFYINNCVGDRNHRYFILFLFWVSLSTLFVAVCSFLTLQSARSNIQVC